MTESTNTKTSLTKVDKTRLSGYLIFLGGLQWFLGLLAAESWTPGYSNRIDYVSELGIWEMATLYNASIFILGICLLVGAYLLYQSENARLFSILLAITGIGAMGLSIFPGYAQPMHSIATLIAILFGTLAAITSFQLQKKPMSYISLILGAMALVSVIIFMPYLGLPTGSTETFLGMAKGSMERWAIYPILAWAISFGSYLIGSTDERTTKK
ncbi:MAG: DUF998 domain-containing protein [Candidatus Thorarchaeota archaeon]|nr:DUF998 domain-containing protein [Candidatus Thorarchaeota archaeon]